MRNVNREASSARAMASAAGRALALLPLITPAFPAWAVAPGAPAVAPPPAAAQPATVTVTGRLTYVNLEGGFYAVDGWMLRGDPALFRLYLDKEVVVTGVPQGGVSYQMVRALSVTSIRPADEAVPSRPPVVPQGQPVSARRPVPAAVAVAGRPVALDPGPVVVDGVLMLPLRPVVEAAGGRVVWEERTDTLTVGGQVTKVRVQSVTVTLGGRTAHLTIGGRLAIVLAAAPGPQSKATGAPDPGIVALAQAPVLMGGRTFVSADALSSALGLLERDPQRPVLDLIPPG